MDSKHRCQSCGMPLGEGVFGTQKDGSPSPEYCKYCFRNGEFMDPDLSLEDMIARSTAQMVTELGFRIKDARALAENFIPNLKRWKS